MAAKSMPQGIINPFSPEFQTTWDLWKQYKLEEFKFKYKGCLSEQAALMRLNDLSGGLELVAVAIIQQSMCNGWKGFFELKDKQNGTTKAATREEINSEFANRSYSNGKH